jgi:hypothetical protein
MREMKNLCLEKAALEIIRGKNENGNAAQGSMQKNLLRYKDYNITRGGVQGAMRRLQQLPKVATNAAPRRSLWHEPAPPVAEVHVQDSPSRRLG